MSSENTPLCPACGRDVRAGARFCRHCGEPLHQPTDAAGTEPTPSPVKRSRGAGRATSDEARPAAAAPSETLPAREEPALRAGPLCPACGGEVRESARFCRHCGEALVAPAPVPVEAPQADPPTKVDASVEAGHPPAGDDAAEKSHAAEPTIQCSACGGDLRAGARFCRHCGAPQGSEAAATAVPIPVSARPPRRKGSPKSLVLIASLAALALAVVGAGGWLAWSRFGARDAAPAGAEDSTAPAEALAVEAVDATESPPDSASTEPPPLAAAPEAESEPPRASGGARPRPRPPRRPEPERPAATEAPAEPRVTCLLPDGSEASLTVADCRGRAGVIY